jgi:CheY-like chemotaxis protein
MRGHRHTIILVDDEGETRDAVRDHLTAIGADVLCARHGRAALQLVALGMRPCAFLVDIESPGVAGAELRRALQYDTGLRHVPVGVLPPLRQRLGRVGPPLDAAELLRAAAHACEDLVAFRRGPTERRLAGATRPLRGPHTHRPSRS